MSSPLIGAVVGRRRTAAVLTASASLVLGTTAIAAFSTAPAQSLPPPAEDCTPTFVVANIENGDLVTGLTVSEGTAPDPFNGEVIGVVESGIAPGLDMVIVDLTSPAIDAAGGIWQGMSGSPVYADDGKLIGAVAYGLSAGPSPIAGVTPFEDMKEYMAAPRPGKVEVSKRMASKIAAHSDVSTSQAEQGLRQLKMPFGVSGVTPARLAKASHDLRRYLPKNTYKAGRAAPGLAEPENVVAGGNLAASVSYGDITQAGVGTATSVCDNRVVGFGHPMTFAGETTMSLHPADAIYIQPDSLGSPYKLANLGEPAGIIDEDHLTGITGQFGDAPDFAEISSTLSYRTTDRTGTTRVTVPEYAASTTFFQVLANHDRVVDAIRKGSEEQSWTIDGVGPDGEDFSLSSSDRYVSSYDISFDASFELSDIVYLLGSVPDLTIETISMTGAVSDDASRYTLTGTQQFRKGVWTKVSRPKPATIRGGKVMKLRAILTSTGGGVVYIPFEFKVPKRLAGAEGAIYLTGGNDFFSEEGFYEFSDGGSPTLADIEDLLAEQIRNDEIFAQMSFFGGGGVIECRGCRGGSGAVERELVLGPAQKVVSGFKQVKVIVKG